MSKPVKKLIMQSYERRFEGIDSGVLIELRGVPSNTNNAFRGALAEHGVRVNVVKNTLARKAFEGTGLAPLSSLLEGSCALVYGGDNVVAVARLLIEQAKQVQLEFRGAVMEGELFEADQVEALSKYPTRDEAQAQVLQIVLTPAQKLAGAIVGPGRKVASLIKAIEEKLENGETIAKAG